MTFWYSLCPVIKGSEGTLAKDSDENWLDRETYLNLSERQQFTFAKQRGRIYDLFERYNKIKAARGDYDAADRFVVVGSNYYLPLVTR